MTVKHGAARGVPLPRIPNSDGAGVVTAVGAGVAGIAVGDRVVSCFFQDWTDGACSPEAMASALGGAVDGVLAEEVVLKADGRSEEPTSELQSLMRIPYAVFCLNKKRR